MFERVQLRELTILKKSGRRTPFEREKLARSISIRMSVLAGAPRLSDVPTRAPIRLRPQKGGFTVNLIETRRLHFQAVGANGAEPPSDLAEIEAIEILGVGA